MDKKLNFALIGEGDLIKKHLSNFWNEDPDLQLQSVLLPDESINELEKSFMQTKRINNINSIVKDDSINMIIVSKNSNCTKHKLIDLIRSKKHCLYENISGIDYEDYCQFANEASHAGVIFSPALNMIYSEFIMPTKKFFIHQLEPMQGFIRIRTSASKRTDSRGGP